MSSKEKGITLRSLVSILCIAVLSPGDTWAYVSPTPQAAPSTAQNQTPSSAAPNPASKIPPDQLDSLVAPIALYPDPLLAQTLAASTYPLEIIQLQQWLEKNKTLKDKALADAVQKHSWDPSVQAMAGLPDVVKRLADDIQWTTDLGNAFLAQQSDVMDAVQRMRKKAEEKGNLKSTEQQKVETKVVESKTVIVVQQSNPQVVYVPSYDPVVVYGSPIYPYPPIYYPPAGYYAAGMALSFGVGVAMGAFWGGGGWGWGASWGGNNDITVNRNANFNRNTNVGNVNRGNGNWQHNPQHRGGAPYRDQATANKFGGTARGDSLANRQTSARQQVNRQGGTPPSTRSGGGGASNKTAGTASANRASGGGGASNKAAGTAGGNRASGGGGGGGSGADRVGSRDVSRSGGGNRDAFSGGSKGYDGASARSSSTRGASSMGSRGGGSRGGGGGRRR
jgi:hypothetical protein